MSKWKKFLIFPLLFLFCMLVLLVAFHPVVRAYSSIFSDGFESGNLSTWTGTTGNPTVQNSTKHSGAYAANFTCATDGNYAYENITVQSTLYVRSYLYYTVNPNQGDAIEYCVLLNPVYLQDQVQGQVQNMNGTAVFGIHFRDSGGTTHDVNSSVFPIIDTWYCMEIYWQSGTKCGMYINGVEVCNSTGYTVQSADIGTVRIGIQQTYPSSTVYVDDVAIGTSYIGPATTQVTFDQVGLNSDFAGPVVAVDGFQYTYTQLPISFWWTFNSSHTFAYQSTLVVSANEKRYAWNSTSGLDQTGQSGSLNFTTSGTIIGTYATQYYLTVETNPVGINSPTGGGWYYTGATAHVSTNEYVDIVLGSSRYKFDSWTDASGSFSDATVTMDSAKTATANYLTQYNVTFAQSGVGSDFIGNVMNVSNVNYTRSGFSDWFDNGASVAYRFYSPLIVTPNGEQYVLTGVSGNSTTPPLIISAATTVTGTYGTQWYISVVSAHGSPTESPQWVDDGSSFSVSVTNPDVVSAGEHQWNLTGLTIDTMPQTVSDTVSYASVHTSHSIVFSWTEQWYINVASAHDLPTSSAWIDNGTSFSVSVTSPADDNGLGTRYRCTGYTLDSNAPIVNGSTSYEFVAVLSNHTITFNWIAQYRVTVVSSHDSPAPTVGDHWYDAGFHVDASVSSPADLSEGTRYNCTGYTGTGSISSGAGTSFSFDIAAPSNLTWNWMTQYYLTVSTSPSGVDSPNGAGWYNSGVTAHVSTTQYVDIVSGNSRYRFNSWTGAYGTYSDATVTMDSAKTATANYVTQYNVTFAQSGVGTDFSGNVMNVSNVNYTRGGFSGWFDDGASVAFNFYSPLVVTPIGEQCVLTGVSGNSTASPLTVSAATIVTGSYGTQWYISVVSDHGSPTQSSRWVIDGGSFSVSVINPDVISSGEHQWNLTSLTINSIAQTLSSTVDFASVHSSYSIVFSWTEQWYITVSSAHGSPPSSTWANTGSSFNASVTSPADVVSGDHQWVCIGYKLDGGTLTVGTSYNFASVAANHTIEFDWIEQYYLTVDTSPLGINSPHGEGWYNVGVTAHVNTTQYVAISSSSRYMFVSWTGASGTYSDATVVMSSAKTATANYVTQYNVTFASLGVSSDFSGTVVTVNGTSHDRLGFSFWADSGNIYDFAYASPLVVTANAERFVWTSTVGLSGVQSGYMTVYASGSVTGNYKIQYYVTFGQTGVGSDYLGNIMTVNSTAYERNGTSFWADSGDTYSFFYMSPLIVGSHRYVWNATSGTLDKTTQTGSVTVSVNGTVVGNYLTQYQVTFSETGVGSDFTGTVVTVDSVGYTLSSLPVSFWWNASSDHGFSFTSPLVVNASKQYSWGSTSGLSNLQSGTLIVAISGTVAGNYIIQNQVTFDKAGVSSDFKGTVLIVDSISYNATELPVSFFWSLYSTHTFAYQSPLVVAANSKQYVWTGTSGLSSLQNGVINVTTFGSAVGSYKTQWWITVSSAHDSPTASSWADNGGSFAASVTSPTEIVPNKLQWVCIGYRIDGGSLTSGVSYSFTSVTANHTISFSWNEQFWVVFSQTGVGSDFAGNVVIVNGTYYNRTGFVTWANSGAVYNFTYVSLLSVNSGEQYVRTSVNASSPVVISGAKTVVGSYKTQYYLTVSSAHDSPGGQGWFDSGSTVYATLTDGIVTGGAGTRYVFTGWSDNASGTGLTSNAVMMNGPKTATANWKTQYYLTFDQDGLDASAIGTVVTINGSAITSTGLPYSLWANSGYSLVFSYVNVTSTATNMRFVVDVVSAASPLTVTGTLTIVGYYKTELLTLQVEGTKGWYWTKDTTITSMAEGDLYGNGVIEIVTGGYYFDGVRDVAQIVIWNSSNRAVFGVATWYWSGNTVINSVTIRDVDSDGNMEIITGGYYFDGTRNVAQLIVWNGQTLAVKQLKVWYWSGNTVIDSVAIGNVYGNSSVEIVTGGYYFDGTRNVAQLAVWGGSDLALKKTNNWYWFGNTTINSVAIGDVDSDGHIEIVTGGYYFDGVREVSQLTTWDGSTLTMKQVAVWSGVGNTVINCVAAGDFNGDGVTEILTGGNYYDGTRALAQLTIWEAIYD